MPGIPAGLYRFGMITEQLTVSTFGMITEQLTVSTFGMITEQLTAFPARPRKKCLRFILFTKNLEKVSKCY